MLDRAFTRVLHRYMEAHSAPMIAAVRSEVRGGPTDGEPQRPRPFCDAWALTLDAAVQELTALQGRSSLRSSLLHDSALESHLCAGAA